MDKRTHRPNAIDAIMAEPIRMPGCPQLIVTRGFAYQWLKRLGYSTAARGFASVDYFVFGGTRMQPVDEPLTDMELPWVKSVLAMMERDCA